MKTAEFVTPKHPDKMCDRISDAILDECMRQDPDSRVAVETMGGHGIVTITGEITTKAYFNAREIAKTIAGDVGVQVNIVKQSHYIANGVDSGGAGDQGIMVGYACNDNDEMIPQELYLARSLCKFLYEKYPYDGKTQITLDDDNKIKTIVASFCKVSENNLKICVEEWLEKKNVDYLVTTHINPAGDWSQGGFDADTGLTGRKLAVDNYGPQIPIGGGAFSGKDSSKVDRSGAYMARRIAVDMVRELNIKNGITVKLAYSIGVKEPVMVSAITDNGQKIDVDTGKYDLTPKGIIKFLDLKKPIFEKTAEWGHFGNKLNWDK